MHDASNVTKYLKKQIEWSQKNAIVAGDIEQFIKLPMAISTPEGLPRKGAKSTTTDYWKSHFGNAFANQ